MAGRNENFWNALRVLSTTNVTNPAVPAVHQPTGAVQKIQDESTGRAAVAPVKGRRGAPGVPRRGGPAGPDAVPGMPKRNIAAPRGVVTGGMKKGVPTVPRTTAKIMDEYESLEEIEALLASARLARNMKRRGFNDSSSVNISHYQKSNPRRELPIPGKVVPIVNPVTSDITTVAEVSALPGLIGQTPENADPRTKTAAADARANTSVAEVVTDAMVSMNVGNAAPFNAVKTSQSAATPASLATIRQVPHQIHDAQVMQGAVAGAVAAQASIAQVTARPAGGGRLSAFKKKATPVETAEVAAAEAEE